MCILENYFSYIPSMYTPESYEETGTSTGHGYRPGATVWGQSLKTGWRVPGLVR